MKKLYSNLPTKISKFGPMLRNLFFIEHRTTTTALAHNNNNNSAQQQQHQQQREDPESLPWIQTFLIEFSS